MKLSVKGIFACLTVLVILSDIPLTARAYTPYYPYEYNDYGESAPAPTGYIPSETITAASLGLSQEFNGISDMYYDNRGFLYILDGGNSRIVKIRMTPGGMTVEHEYIGAKDAQGADMKFIGAGSITVGPDNTMYVADTKGYRILAINEAGVIIRTITRPDEALKNTNALFDVKHVMLDHDGNIYATATSINLGIMIFSPEGEFLQFWGANQIQTSAQAVINYIRKRFLTQIQLQSMTRSVPVTVESFDIDPDGFVYTISPYRNIDATAVEPGMLRKLNYKGEDVLDKSLLFGDTEWDRKPVPLNLKTWFNDVDIDDRGFINLLDPVRGRVYQYTDNGQLISVFGALGSQTGCFTSPSSIESIGETVYVSDSTKNVIYGFSPTAYVRDMRTAVYKLNQYDLEGSRQEWESILSKNTNSIYAYLGMGRVHDSKGEYREAMRYFKLAGARAEYSKTFEQYRAGWMEVYYPVLILVFLALIAAVVIAAKLISRYSRVAEGHSFSPLESKYAFPIYTLFHPADGFAQFKFRHNQSIALSASIIALWFFAAVTCYFATGIPYNTNRPVDFSLFITLIQTVGLFILFVAANWTVCTLIDGKGKLTEIIATTSYSLLPYILSIFIRVSLSNVLTLEESVFIGIVSTLGLLWSAFLLISGMLVIHQYSFVKTLLSLMFTVVGMFLIIFLIILFCGLLQQAVTFLISLYREAKLRI